MAIALVAVCAVLASPPAHAALRAGAVTEFSAGISPGSTPSGIAAGPDGNLWFVEVTGNRIGRIGGGLAVPPVTTPTTPAPTPRPSAPPPSALVLKGVAGTLTWRQSKPSERLRILGRSDRATTLEVALLRGRRVLAKRTAAVSAGAFTARVPIPRVLLPGPYAVRVRATSAAPRSPRCRNARSRFV